MSEYITKDAILNKTVNKNHAWLYTTNAEGKNLKEIVDELPSVDVRANIHGHWLIQKHGLFMRSFWCSRCGMYSASDAFNYCPWCGADMDEKPELEGKA